MTETDNRPGEGHRGDVNDQPGGEVSSERSRITRLPVPSLTAALDRLDDLNLCCCLDCAPRPPLPEVWSR